MRKIGVGFASISQLEKNYINEALDNSRLSSGTYVHRFEKLFAKKHGKKYGVMCNSGTSAIHIALQTLKEVYGWPDEAEVLVPALTFISSANAIIHAGLKPVFVDVNAKTYNIEPKEIERHINANTRAILPVHCFGLPCEMDYIHKLAQKYDLRIVEDCSDAHFAIYKGRTVGYWGDLSAFSTYVAHTIMTGIGGITITNNSRYAEILRSLIAHGRACTCEVCVASDSEQVCKKRSFAGELDRRFTFERMGYSYRIGELEGALGLAQIERSDTIMAKRRYNAKLLTKLLLPYQEFLQLPIYGSEYDHTFMMYPIMILSDKFTRKDICAFLENHNIETRPLFPLLNQPLYKKMYPGIENSYPVAKEISQKGFYVGCHHGLDEDDILYIGQTIFAFLTQSAGANASSSIYVPDFSLRHTKPVVYLNQESIDFPIGFGTAELGDNEEKIFKLIKTAVHNGIRLIDTASVYGSERAVGQAVREMISNGEIKREDLFIQSKLAPDCHGREKTQECLNKTLEQTGLEYLDAYLIHWPVPRFLEDTYRELNLESWKVMEEFHRKGKVRQLGICNFLERHLMYILNGCAISPTIGQLEIHPKFQQRGLCKFYREQGLFIQAWGSVMNADTAEIKAIAEKYGKNVQQLCLRWSVQKGFLPLMRSTKEKHIRQNIEIQDFVISQEDMAALDAMNTDTCYRDMWAYKRQRMY